MTTIQELVVTIHNQQQQIEKLTEQIQTLLDFVKTNHKTGEEYCKIAEKCKQLEDEQYSSPNILVEWPVETRFQIFYYLCSHETVHVYKIFGKGIEGDESEDKIFVSPNIHNKYTQIGYFHRNQFDPEVFKLIHLLTFGKQN